MNRDELPTSNDLTEATFNRQNVEIDRLTAEVERWTTGYNGLMRVTEKQDAELARLTELTRRHGPDEVPPIGAALIVSVDEKLYFAHFCIDYWNINGKDGIPYMIGTRAIDGWYFLPEVKHE